VEANTKQLRALLLAHTWPQEKTIIQFINDAKVAYTKELVRGNEEETKEE